MSKYRSIECTYEGSYLEITILWGEAGSRALSNTSGMVGRWRRKLGAFDLLTDTIWKGVEESLHLESLGSDRYRIRRRSQRDR